MLTFLEFAFAFDLTRSGPESELNPLHANPTKWSNTETADELFECVLIFLWGWRLKG